MNDDQRELCRCGSVEAAAEDIGREAAEQALHELTIRAPEEIQSSWPMVIQWSRLQIAYEDAMAIGDIKTAMSASQMCSALLTGLY